MEEFGSTRPLEVDDEQADSMHGPEYFMRWTGSLREGLRRTIMFICYVPGVFGFLWLIGRILRR